MALDRDWKCVVPGLRVRFYNNSGGAHEEGDAITISGGTVGKADDSCTTGLYGIVCADVASATAGEMYISGLFKVYVYGTIDFAPNDPVYAQSSSTVDTGTAGDVALGYIALEDPASGASEVTVAILSILFTATTHA